MIIVYTGNEEIDKALEKEIQGTMIVSYEDFLIEDNKFENQIVILSAKAIQTDLLEYLFKLRKLNIRVILLLKEEKEEATKIALNLGIYDLVFSNFYASQIKELIEKPREFKDIAKLYQKIFDIKIKRKSFMNRRKSV